MDEQELLRQLQKQRAGALEKAVAKYGAYVLAIIRNRSRGVLTPEDHEEIASDVFFALWNGAARIERGQLRPWLGAVARNRTAEAMRKQNVYLPLEDDTLITLDRLWEQMMEKERCAAVAQAMRALPDEDREIFYRFYDLSQTAAQIAEDNGLLAQYPHIRVARRACRLPIDAEMEDALTKRKELLELTLQGDEVLEDWAFFAPYAEQAGISRETLLKAQKKRRRIERLKFWKKRPVQAAQ